jgi:hypothetical protein
MAQVVPDAELRARIDRYLAYLFDQWEQLPEMAAEWDEWDHDSRLTFALNWGVPADRLAQLRGWAADGLLTPAQRERYDALLALVEINRETLTYLLES